VNRRAPATQGGFALVLALGAIAVILLLAAALDAWVGSRVEQARLIRARVQDELDAYSTRSTLLYLLATQRDTRAGLTTNEPRATITDDTETEFKLDAVGGEIALDGTPYRGLGRVRFALQDQSGLVALNGETQAQLKTLLQAFSGDAAEITGLLDKLGDYRDANSMRRLNGAEAEEYASARLEPPANYHLRTVPELLRVLDWRDWLAAHPALRLNAWCSIARTETFNPNLVPADLLVHMLDINPKQAAAMVTERQKKPFANVADFNARAEVDLGLDEEQFRFFPTDSLQVRIWSEGAAQAEVLALQLTPLGRQGPWQIGSTYRITQDIHDEAHEVPGEHFGTSAIATR
jgi:general secretion pathway protein K